MKFRISFVPLVLMVLMALSCYTVTEARSRAPDYDVGLTVKANDFYDYIPCGAIPDKSQVIVFHLDGMLNDKTVIIPWEYTTLRSIPYWCPQHIPSAYNKHLRGPPLISKVMQA